MVLLAAVPQLGDVLELVREGPALGALDVLLDEQAEGSRLTLAGLLGLPLDHGCPLGGGNQCSLLSLGEVLVELGTGLAASGHLESLEGGVLPVLDQELAVGGAGQGLDGATEHDVMGAD